MTRHLSMSLIQKKYGKKYVNFMDSKKSNEKKSRQIDMGQKKKDWTDKINRSDQTVDHVKKTCLSLKVRKF